MDASDAVIQLLSEIRDQQVRAIELQEQVLARQANSLALYRRVLLVAGAFEGLWLVVVIWSVLGR